jgi:hypothetical protein
MNIITTGPAQAPILFVAVQMIQNTVSATSRSMSSRVYKNDNPNLALDNIQYIFEHVLGPQNIYAKQFDLPQPGGFHVFMNEAKDQDIAFCDVDSVTLYTSVEQLQRDFSVLKVDALRLLSTLTESIRNGGTTTFLNYMADDATKHTHLDAYRTLHAQKERF